MIVACQDLLSASYVVPLILSYQDWLSVSPCDLSMLGFVFNLSIWIFTCLDLLSTSQSDLGMQEYVDN
jgi:hypothetical protein